MEKQTTIDWLNEQYHKVPPLEFGRLFQQAKEMSDDELKTKYIHGFLDGRNLNKTSSSLTPYDLDELAQDWVFNENGHKWSNNDNTAGDNFGSFKAGFQKAIELLTDNKK